TVIADGTAEANKRLELVLKADPALGVIRYASAGYKKAEGIVTKPTFPIRCVPGETSK
ncbi:MAG: hypothetical protein GX992_00280, partial [Clostridium sp.]|nr:hypothetical protein [Clostridium sp.]